MTLSLIIPSSPKIQANVNLAELTSYRIGGQAQWYASVRTQGELEQVFQWYLKQSIPLTFLGAGSNLLVSDEGLAGLVLSSRHLRYYNFDPVQGQVTASAGEPIARIAWQAAKLGLSGLEWAVGIPGTVGGAVVMNAGAHQKSIADVLVSAQVASLDGSLKTCTTRDLQFSYRSSILQKDPGMVVEATFGLQSGFDRAIVMETTNNNLQQRKNSQPYNHPSCGSVFRNPYPQAAGWLIEQMGLKGYQIGQAQISQRHANFIINLGKAKADDVFRLINYIQDQVKTQWSISLEPEVKMLGEFPVL